MGGERFFKRKKGEKEERECPVPSLLHSLLPIKEEEKGRGKERKKNEKTKESHAKIKKGRKEEGR